MKQQPVLGFLFALTAAMAWGSLPVALKQVLNVMTTPTIVWFRFVVAFVSLFLLLGLSKKLPHIREFSSYYVRLAVIGVIGLAGNFFLFNSSLRFVEPSVAQIFIHLTSFLMLLCGVVFFKEKLGLHQKLGLGILIFGLILFFNDKWEQLFSAGKYATGILLSISAAFVWVAYGMAQKMMLRKFSSQQILMLMYFGCAILFTPFAEVSQVSGLSGLSLACFIYCCLNTIFGYGAYAEALNRWEVSKVSVVITLVPLFTILFAHLAHWMAPQEFNSPTLNSLSYVGAMVVVCGAILSAIGHKLLKSKPRA